MTIAPVLNIDRSKMGTLGILLKIGDGVHACFCNIYTAILKQFTQYAFFYDSHFSTKDNSECYSAIIDNISYAPICVLEVKDRTIKNILNNMFRNFFDGTCTVKYAFKITSHDSP